MPRFTARQRIWRFDENRREYEHDADGRTFGGPIYEKHFVEYRVIAIEARSYLIQRSSPHKERIGISKADREFYGDEDKLNNIWMNHHRYKVQNAVGKCKDVAILRKVAEIVGYQETQ